MELSASYSHRIGEQSSVFVYGGLPGEPAFGPPPFMHRLSAMDSPEAPIDAPLVRLHTHYLRRADGWRHAWRLESSKAPASAAASRMKIDIDIESGDLDSSALRVSWNPTGDYWSLPSHRGRTSPRLRRLEPDEDEERWSVKRHLHAAESAKMRFTRSATLAYSRTKERSDGVSLDAWLAEAVLASECDRWTVVRARRSDRNR